MESEKKRGRSTPLSWATKGGVTWLPERFEADWEIYMV
jgi:hypothetical protein